MFGIPTGRSTSNASVFAEAAVCDFVAAKVSERLTVKISPTSRARRSVANKPPFDAAYIAPVGAPWSSGMWASG